LKATRSQLNIIRKRPCIHSNRKETDNGRMVFVYRATDEMLSRSHTISHAVRKAALWWPMRATPKNVRF